MNHNTLNHIDGMHADINRPSTGEVKKSLAILATLAATVPSVSACSHIDTRAEGVHCTGIQNVHVRPGDTLNKILNEKTANNKLSDEDAQRATLGYINDRDEVSTSESPSFDYTVTAQSNLGTSNFSASDFNVNADEWLKTPKKCTSGKY